MPSQDPRSYVRALPLPIDSPVGLKLQARSATILNPTVPTREEVRKVNYARRLQQIGEQGFSSCNYKPYKGLGDPFYLEEKKLILHSLGQWNESENTETSSSSENEEVPEATVAAAPQAALAAAKFFLKRSRTNLNTLNKEIVKERNLIRNVSLGHSLFDLIRQERQAKKATAFAEKQRSIEEARNQWKPPKDSSDEDVSEDEISKNDDLQNFSRPKTTSSRNKSSRKNKKQVTPRPFTPQYNNLMEVEEHMEDICRDIGGSKISAKKARDERRTETEWERWLTNQQLGKGGKKGSYNRSSRLTRTSRVLSQPRVSLQSRSISPSSSSSQALSAPQGASLSISSQTNALNQVAVSGQKEINQTGSRVATPTVESEEETLHRTGIFKFLDEYYDSLRREEERKREAELSSSQANQKQLLKMENKDLHIVKKDIENKSMRKYKNSQEKQATLDRLSQPQPVERARTSCNFKDLHNSFTQPKTSAELMEFHANKYSNKYANQRQDLQNKFKEIQDDKAMTLHDILAHIDRNRLAKCQIMFRSLNPKSLDFYRAVKEMRKEEHKMLTRSEMIGRQSSIKGNWYTDLLVNLPDEVRDIWYYQVIIQKIGRYGMVENTSKQSVYKFLKVLESLRHWEICSPNISAAIEFCRSKIVEMSIDEYEEWFAQAFPRVLRPKTAPAVLRVPQQNAASKHGSH